MSIAYLEDYREIKIITNNYNKDTNISFFENDITLTLQKKYQEQGMIHLHFIVEQDILPHKDYYIMIDEEKVFLHLGKIARSSLFDTLNYYDGPLGFTYTKKKTTFRLWTPVSKEVKIVFPNKNKIYDLTYINKGLWEITIKGNLDKEAYYYLVRINQEFSRTQDPYGVSSSLKDDVNYVVNLNKTYKMKNSYVKTNSINDMIIYEAHLKDLTYHLNGISCYKKAVNMRDYISNLGITHLQLQPVNSFYGVDEINKDKYYNWGYNPKEYMTLTGWYASCADDPYCKINEFKELVDKYHEVNIGINIDCVFNHVYNHQLFSYGILVPGYSFRCDQFGFMSNGSYCGNDLATERKMIRRLIVDTCKFFSSFYMVDGIRFDLMGLIDIETLKQIEEELLLINNSSVFYGEGWVMNTALDNSLLGCCQSALTNFGYFNDSYRDFLKGSINQKRFGILMGNNINSKELIYHLKGGKSPKQSINYIECHDNYTLNDLMDLAKITNIDEKKDYLKLGLGLLMISIGIPFIHFGMEIGRSKHLVENSYKSNMDINGINVDDFKNYEDVINYLKKMIDFRKKVNTLRLNDVSLIENQYIVKNITKDYIILSISDYEILITNKYVTIDYYNTLINKPGVYVFLDHEII